MNSENRNFENEWKRAFTDAESDVNDAVWANIDSKLATAENGAMKKRVVFYQWLAAASAVFALLVGGALLVGRSDKNEPALSQRVEKRQRTATDATNEPSKNEIANAQPKKDFTPANTSKYIDAEKTNPSVLNNQSVNRFNKQTTVNQKIEEQSIAHSTIGVTRNKSSVVKYDHTKSNADSQRLSSENSTTTIVVADGTEKESGTTITVNEPKVSETPIASNATVDAPMGNPLLATDTSAAFIESPIKISSKDTPTESNENTQTRKVTTEKWWASLTGSAGSYTTIGGSSPALNSSLNANSANANNASNSSTEKVGTSFSYGINVGKQIAPRWVVITGVGYMSQSINYSSNVAVFSQSQAQAFMADVSKVAATTNTAISSYELTSTNEFVTIPMQAGYLIVNRKLGVQLNAGFASDLFLRNTLSDPAGKFSSNTQFAGETSTYKTINWSGLVGTELSYKISSRYRLSVIPGMRYSFGSILKSNVGGSITPLIWDVGFRFKYIF
jgi:hypothetical protein